MKEDLSTRDASPVRATASIRGALTAAALALLLGFGAPAAQALPVNASCVVTTYYADASMTTKVGSYSTCPGSRGLTGRRTAFFDVDEIQIGNPPGPKPPGQSKFPCDLQANCVTSLPTPIVVKPWPSK